MSEENLIRTLRDIMLTSSLYGTQFSIALTELLVGLSFAINIVSTPNALEHFGTNTPMGFVYWAGIFCVLGVIQLGFLLKRNDSSRWFLGFCCLNMTVLWYFAIKIIEHQQMFTPTVGAVVSIASGCSWLFIRAVIFHEFFEEHQQ